MTLDCGSVWLEKSKYDEAETKYYLWLQKKLYGIDIEATSVGSGNAVLSNKQPTATAASPQSKPVADTKPVSGSLSGQIAAARQQIKESLAVSNDSVSSSPAIPQQSPSPQQQKQQQIQHAANCPRSKAIAAAVAAATASSAVPCSANPQQARSGSANRNSNLILPTPQPMPTNAKKKRRRNRSRRKRSKSARASSCCQSVSPGRMSVASNLSLQAQGSTDMAMTQQVEELKKTVDSLVDKLKKVELRMSTLEEACSCGASQKAKPAAPKAAPKPAAAGDDDDDVDLFGSDDDAEADAVRQERLKAYAEKKSKKPALIAKSSVVLDVKPWDDETDMKALEAAVRSVAMDGLVWGTSKLVPVGYGINKMQIVCVVEDDKVSIDELAEKLTEFEDFVQSVDIAAFNKI